jgi:RimJ/RimL family protein N-acetyltransferase
MTKDRIRTFRKLVTLKDGARVLFRVLGPSDADALVDFFQTSTKDEIRYIRSDVKNQETVRKWALEPDFESVLPIVACVQDRIVGEATLHFMSGPHSHVAEVRIFLAGDFRRRGLGIQLLETMFELARWRDIQALEARVVVDQSWVVKAFKKLGFEQQGTLEDYFMTPDRGTRDEALLIKRLRVVQDEF